MEKFVPVDNANLITSMPKSILDELCQRVGTSQISISRSLWQLLDDESARFGGNTQQLLDNLDESGELAQNIQFETLEEPMHHISILNERCKGHANRAVNGIKNVLGREPVAISEALLKLIEAAIHDGHLDNIEGILGVMPNLESHVICKETPDRSITIKYTSAHEQQPSRIL